MVTEQEDRFAPEGFLWVCCACGKTSEHEYGMGGRHSAGWDESCVLNSQLFAKDRLTFSPDGNRVVRVAADLTGARDDD